jgi:hypothetical protein
VYCWVTPGAKVAPDGRTCNAVMVVDDGKNCPQPATIIRNAMTNAVVVINGDFCTLYRIIRQ